MTARVVSALVLPGALSSLACLLVLFAAEHREDYSSHYESVRITYCLSQHLHHILLATSNLSFVTESEVKQKFQHKLFYLRIFKALMKPLHNNKKTLKHHTPKRFQCSFISWQL